MKNDNTKLIIWALIAFIIGVIIGMFIISPIITGNANYFVNPNNNEEQIKGLYPGSNPGGSPDDREIIKRQQSAGESGLQ